MQIKSAGQGAAGIAAARIQATCTPGVTVIKDGKPVRAIHGVTIRRGATVDIESSACLATRRRQCPGKRVLGRPRWARGHGRRAARRRPRGGKTIEEATSRSVLVGGAGEGQAGGQTAGRVRRPAVVWGLRTLLTHCSRDILDKVDHQVAHCWPWQERVTLGTGNGWWSSVIGLCWKCWTGRR